MGLTLKLDVGDTSSDTKVRHEKPVVDALGALRDKTNTMDGGEGLNHIYREVAEQLYLLCAERA